MAHCEGMSEEEVEGARDIFEQKAKAEVEGTRPKKAKLH